MSDVDRIARVRGESLCVEVTPDEITYRNKYLPDPTVLNDDMKKLICTVCNTSLAFIVKDGSDLYVHRVLQVLVCKKCYDFYGDGNFSVDEDGDDKYCRWCGQGGELYMCSACTCAFCKKCIRENLKASVLADLEKDDWKCLVCHPRPMFGCRAICWGAQELNKAAKEEKKRKRQEWLEKKNKEKLEKEKTARSSRKSDGVKAKKRKIEESDSSSSAELVPAKKARGGRVNGRRRKADESEDSSNSDASERRVRTRRKQNTKRDSISDSSKGRGKLTRSNKKVETSDDETDDERPKKKVLKKKKASSSSASSDDNHKKTSLKKASDTSKKMSEVLKKSLNEEVKKKEIGGEKIKLMTDSDDSSSAKNKLVKKKVDMAIVWLQSAVKDIADLGIMIAQRATKYSDRKLNSGHIKTNEDVLATVEKLQGMINNIHLNYSHLETKLNGQLDGWKLHAGIGERNSDKVDRNNTREESNPDGGETVLVKASVERCDEPDELNGQLDGGKLHARFGDQNSDKVDRPNNAREESNADGDESVLVKASVKRSDEPDEGKGELNGEDSETPSMNEESKPAESAEKQAEDGLEDKTGSQPVTSSFATSTPIKLHSEAPGE